MQSCTWTNGVVQCVAAAIICMLCSRYLGVVVRRGAVVQAAQAGGRYGVLANCHFDFLDAGSVTCGHCTVAVGGGMHVPVCTCKTAPQHLGTSMLPLGVQAKCPAAVCCKVAALHRDMLR